MNVKIPTDERQEGRDNDYILQVQPEKSTASGGRKRYCVLDGIRGFALINMVIYHAVWDMVNLLGFDWKWYSSEGAYIWQQFICWTFIFVSGFCCPLGSRKLRRGLTVFAMGFLVSMVTWIFTPESVIVFGVLTLAGSCMLISALLQKPLDKVPPAVGAAISTALFIITRNVNRGFLGFGGWNILKLPESWYSGLFNTYLGFAEAGFRSTDYFSLFPWLFLFLTGYFVSRLMQGSKLMGYLEKPRIKALETVGRYSLQIYMLHQPVLYGCFMLLTAACRNMLC